MGTPGGGASVSTRTVAEAMYEDMSSACFRASRARIAGAFKM